MHGNADSGPSHMHCVLRLTYTHVRTVHAAGGIGGVAPAGLTVRLGVCR
jgi:hypothetical protein